MSKQETLAQQAIARERKNERQRQWRKTHRESANATHKKWRVANPDKVKERSRKCYAKLRNNPVKWEEHKRRLREKYAKARGRKI